MAVTAEEENSFFEWKRVTAAAAVIAGFIQLLAAAVAMINLCVFSWFNLCFFYSSIYIRVLLLLFLLYCMTYYFSLYLRFTPQLERYYAKCLVSKPGKVASRKKESPETSSFFPSFVTYCGNIFLHATNPPSYGLYFLNRISLVSLDCSSVVCTYSPP